MMSVCGLVCTVHHWRTILPAPSEPAQPAVAPASAPDEMPPLPSMEGQQGPVISRTAVSPPTTKKKREEAERVKRQEAERKAREEAERKKREAERKAQK